MQLFCAVLYRSLLYSIFLFLIYFVWFGACVVRAQPYLHIVFYLVWGMRRACTAVLASLRLFDSLTHNAQYAADTVYPMRVLPPGILTYKQRTFHYAHFATKSNTDSSQCCSPSDHTSRCAALYIAHCSYDTHNAAILGDVTAELANATSYDCVIRAGRKRSKIEIMILAISIKGRDRRRIFQIFDPDNRGEDRSLRRRSRSRSPTLVHILQLRYSTAVTVENHTGWMMELEQLRVQLRSHDLHNKTRR